MLGSTEVRLCGVHRGADTGGVPGYTEVSTHRPGDSEVLCCYTASFSLSTAALHTSRIFFAPIDIVMVPSSPPGSYFANFPEMSSDVLHIIKLVKCHKEFKILF